MKFDLNRFFIALFILIGFSFATPTMAGQRVGPVKTQLIVSGGVVPPNEIMVMGTKDAGLFQARFTAVGGSVTITDFQIKEEVLAGWDGLHTGFFSNFKLFIEFDQIPANAVFGQVYGNMAVHNVHLVNPIKIARGETVLVTITADCASFAAKPFAHGTTYKVGMSEKGIVARDAADASVPASFGAIAPSGPQLQMARSKADVSTNTLGATTGRPRSSVDDLAILTIAAHEAGVVSVQNITLAFGGSFPLSKSFLEQDAILLDENTWTVYRPEAMFVDKSGSLRATFNMGSYRIDAGQQKTFKLRLNTAMPLPYVPNPTLSVKLADMQYRDALPLDSAGITLAVLPQSFPNPMIVSYVF